MLDVTRLDVVNCSTALEVELLAALVRERRLRLQNAPLKIAKPRPKPKIIDIPAFELRAVPAVPEPPPRAAFTVSQIVRCVAVRWKIHRNDILSPRRQWYLVEPRQVACMLARALTPASFPYIGRKLGGRDHTTIIHGADKMNWLRLRLMDELKPYDPLERWVDRAYEIIQSTKQPTQREAANDLENQKLEEIPALQGPQSTMDQSAFLDPVER
jgi:hypothetical protein